LTQESSTEIIVLGRRITEKLRPNHIFSLRLHKAAEVYKTMAGQRRIVVSGGDVGRFGVTEAQAGSEYLADELAVPKTDILREEQALDTVSNAVFCKLLLLKSGCLKPIIISSCYHIPRVSFSFSHILGPDFEPTFISASSGLEAVDYSRHWRSESQKLVEATQFFERLDTPPGAHEPVLEYLLTNGFVVEDTVE
jgi:uncharacterized SAM-binding protein YcdF (DUF218 family)